MLDPAHARPALRVRLPVHYDLTAGPERRQFPEDLGRSWPQERDGVWRASRSD